MVYAAGEMLLIVGALEIAKSFEAVLIKGAWEEIRFSAPVTLVLTAPRKSPKHEYAFDSQCDP